MFYLYVVHYYYFVPVGVAIVGIGYQTKFVRYGSRYMFGADGYNVHVGIAIVSEAKFV
jgi:hypothetical protein